MTDTTTKELQIPAITHTYDSDDDNMGLASDNDLESGGASMSSDGRTLNGKSAEEARKEDATLKMETTQITRLRVIVAKALLLITLTVSIVIFHKTKKTQDEVAREQFEGAAELILESFHSLFQTKLGAVASLAMGISLDYSPRGFSVISQWPFVTVPNFQQRALAARKQSGAVYLHMNHRVTSDEREEWERYAVGEESAAWM